MARVKRAVNAHKRRRVVTNARSGYRGQRSAFTVRQRNSSFTHLTTASATVRLAR